MSWFNLNDSLNNIKGQITSFATDVLADETGTHLVLIITFKYLITKAEVGMTLAISLSVCRGWQLRYNFLQSWKRHSQRLKSWRIYVQHNRWRYVYFSRFYVRTRFKGVLLVKEACLLLFSIFVNLVWNQGYLKVKHLIWNPFLFSASFCLKIVFHRNDLGYVSVEMTLFYKHQYILAIQSSK